MWRPYWNLRFDPFAATAGVYVPSTGHEEAVARLVVAATTGDRLVVLRGEAGSGRSVVLHRAARAIRAPSRRLARVTAPIEPACLYAGLAEQLGMGVDGLPSLASAWAALGRALRVCQWQNVQPILVVDQAGPALDESIVRLASLADGAGRLTVWTTGPEAVPTLPPAFGQGTWRLAVRLPRLLRRETFAYVEAKLRAAGRVDAAFDDLALERLYDLTGGLPRAIDRMAALGLAAGAADGSALVTADTLEAVADECVETTQEALF